MSPEIQVAIYPGAFALAGVVIGTAATVLTGWISSRAQQKQQKLQIQAVAVEAEAGAFRAAVTSVLDQVFSAQNARRASSQEALLNELYEFDRHIHRLALFGSTELITASGTLAAALRNYASGAPIVGPDDPRSVQLYKAKTVWLTRARKEILELRGITLEHSTAVKETTEILSAQMERLAVK